MTLWFWMMYLPPWKSWILSELQLFQSFPTKVAKNDSEWPINIFTFQKYVKQILKVENNVSLL